MSTRADPQGGPLWVGLVLLTVANALLYAVAAILHWRAQVVLGPVTLAFPETIPAASIVGGAIALILAAAAIGLLAGARPDRRSIWFAYVAALIGTLFGLTIALLRNLPPPDIWVHIVMLAGLASGFVMLFAMRRAWQLAADKC